MFDSVKEEYLGDMSELKLVDGKKEEVERLIKDHRDQIIINPASVDVTQLSAR